MIMFEKIYKRKNNFGIRGKTINIGSTRAKLIKKYALSFVLIIAKICTLVVKVMYQIIWNDFNIWIHELL